MERPRLQIEKLSHCNFLGKGSFSSCSILMNYPIDDTLLISNSKHHHASHVHYQYCTCFLLTHVCYNHTLYITQALSLLSMWFSPKAVYFLQSILIMYNTMTRKKRTLRWTENKEILYLIQIYIFYIHFKGRGGLDFKQERQHFLFQLLKVKQQQTHPLTI